MSPQIILIIERTKELVVGFLTSTTFERFYFFFEVLVLGICALLVWLMILMGLRSKASWKAKSWVKAFSDPKKKKK